MKRKILTVILSIGAIIFIFQTWHIVNIIPTEKFYHLLGLPYSLWGLFQFSWIIIFFMFLKEIIVKISNHFRVTNINTDSIEESSLLYLHITTSALMLSYSISFIWLIMGSQTPFSQILELYLACFFLFNIIALYHKPSYIRRKANTKLLRIIKQREANNHDLINYIETHKSDWQGPIKVDVNLIHRTVGPEPQMINKESAEEFESKVENITERLRINPGMITSLVCEKNGDKYMLLDGNHTFEAMKKLGKTKLSIIYVEDSVSHNQMNI